MGNYDWEEVNQQEVTSSNLGVFLRRGGMLLLYRKGEMVLLTPAIFYPGQLPLGHSRSLSIFSNSGWGVLPQF